MAADCIFLRFRLPNDTALITHCQGEFCLMGRKPQEVSQNAN
jgi:hypothetical protein